MGATGGTGGTAGSGGTGGAGGVDASAGAGGMDAGLVCAPMLDLDGGVDGAVTDASAADSGSGDAATDGGDAGGSVYKWRDWANNACKDCPAPMVDCVDFEGASTFDPATRILKLELAPATADVIHGTVSLHWIGQAKDGGTPPSGYTNTLPLTVDKNALTADFSADVPTGAIAVGSISLELRDACGTTSYPPLMHSLAPEAGTVMPIYCEF